MTSCNVKALLILLIPLTITTPVYSSSLQPISPWLVPSGSQWLPISYSEQTLPTHKLTHTECSLPAHACCLRRKLNIGKPKRRFSGVGGSNQGKPARILCYTSTVVERETTLMGCPYYSVSARCVIHTFQTDITIRERGGRKMEGKGKSCKWAHQRLQKYSFLAKSVHLFSVGLVK